MTDEDKTPLLVLKNGAGDYFLVPQEVLERGRVPAEHKADVERLMAEASTDDVAGHVWWFGVGMVTGAAVQGAVIVAIATYETGTLKGLDRKTSTTPAPAPS
jgi:hypothetical protein